MAEEKKQKNGFVQFLLFIVMSLVAFAAQIVIVTWGDDLFNLIPAINGQEIDAWIFGVQPLAVFIAFLIGNIVAKVLSYILNRKKTFGAVNNLVFSMTVYTIMCVVLIIVETLIGSPFGKWLANTLPDGFWNILGTSQAQELANPDWSSTIAMIIYSTADFLIVFLMEKFVIMNDNLFKNNKKNKYLDEASAQEEATTEDAPADEVKDEEAPVEEANEEPKHEQAIEEDVVVTPADEAKFEEEEKAAAEAKAKEEAEAKAKKEAEEKAAAEAKAKEEAEAQAKKEAEEKAAAEAKAKEEAEAKAKKEAEEKAAAEAQAKKEAEEKAAAEAKAKEEAKAEVKEEPKAEEPAKEEVKEEEPAKEEVKEEAPKAEKKAPAKKAATKAKNAGKVEFELRVDGYHFEVSAMNGQLMFESQGFASAETAKSGFDTFKAALEDPETPTSVYQDKRGLWRFVINKRYVGEGYKTRAQAEAAIESVKRDALLGTVADIEEDPEEKKAYAAAKKNFNKGTGVDWDKALKAPAKTFGKFEISGHEGRGYFFTLYANNGQILYCSRYYASEESCGDAIITFKKACYLDNFFIDKDKFGNWRFVLKGTGAGICYYGESYSTKDAAESSSESVKKFAMTAKIVVVDEED